MTSNMTFKDATNAMINNREVVKGISRKSLTFDGYIIRPRYSKEAKRVLQLNNEYIVTYVASPEDLAAKDWYILYY